MNTLHIDLIRRILHAADLQRMPLWIGGGWAIDARLGRITRPHDDIDLTFPGERREAFETLITALGGRVLEETGYGFLAELEGVLLDCEPAHWNGHAYEIEDTPPGSCPDAAEGRLDGLVLRCNSWEAILWDYFYYTNEVPWTEWPDKHVRSYELACAAFGTVNVEVLRAAFDRA